jgi:creatinine amidohydrolase
MSRIPAVREGWAWMPRPWTQVTDDTGVGNPAGATPEKGSAFFEAVAEAIGTFLCDLAAAEPGELYGG